MTTLPRPFPRLFLRFFLLALSCFSFTVIPDGLQAGEVHPIPGFYVASDKPGPWPDILHSLGIREQTRENARVFILPEGSQAIPQIVYPKDNRIFILEGDSEMARDFGIFPAEHDAQVRKVRDIHQPGLSIVWEKPVKVPRYKIPRKAKILMWDRAHRTPLMAVLRTGTTSVLWMATSPGTGGYERYPFLLQTLMEMGLEPIFESRRLWAFFDPAFQRNRDALELAREWRQMGLASIHVGVWDYFEGTNPGEDMRLRRLIKACHREGILVYAWLELPHVSVEFWNRHPQWREKTAQGKDAEVDWRLLMNLANPDCRRAVVKGIRKTIARFDWDGVNFAELYFDGVEGIKNLEEFTPLNRDVRREVRLSLGFDPMELFSGSQRDPRKLRMFLDYRIDLAARLQEFWIEELEKMRAEKPYLDLVLTYVDDRFDTTMRDALGADAARSLKGVEHHDLTFIIEDPCTLWYLGPKRYAEISARYRTLTTRQERLGVDINVVAREKAYPTEKQTGVELAQLVHTAAESFSTVMYYYTGSIDPLDTPLLPYASAVATKVEPTGDGLMVESPCGIGVRWSGPANVDGKPWPIRDERRVWLPAGKHVLRSSATDGSPLILDFNGNLEDAAGEKNRVEITYNAQSRAFARLSQKPRTMLLDGREISPVVSGRYTVQLPKGRHTVKFCW